MITKESRTKVIVGIWKDKLDVLLLTTESVPELVEVQTKRKGSSEAKVIHRCVGPESIILSTAVRRGIKCYRKVTIELLANTAVVNTLLLRFKA
jgi:hypothetical protein